MENTYLIAVGALIAFGLFCMVIRVVMSAGKKRSEDDELYYKILSDITFEKLYTNQTIKPVDKYEQIATWIKEIEEMQGSKIEVNNDQKSTTFNSENKITIIRLGGMTLDAVYYYLEDEHERAKRRAEKEASMQPFDFSKFTKL